MSFYFLDQKIQFGSHAKIFDWHKEIDAWGLYHMLTFVNYYINTLILHYNTMPS